MVDIYEIMRDCDEESEKKIAELEAEQKQLKADLEKARSYKHVIKMNNRNLTTEKKRLKKEIAKLKCLALHLFSELGFYATDWYSGYDERKTRWASKWWKIHLKCGEAYRKAKKALREEK